VQNGSSARKASSEDCSSLVPGERRRFYCEACDHEADIRGGAYSCDLGSFSTRCPRGAECLRHIAERLACRPYQLLDPQQALTHLAPWLFAAGRYAAGDVRLAPLPTLEMVTVWQRMLRESRRASGYLADVRGILPSTIARYAFGWDGEAITLPIYDAAGALVNLRRRKLGEGQSFKGTRGRGSQLFPVNVITGSGPLAVCEGEFDAVVLNQSGLPAVTSTAGAGHWKPEWTPLLGNHCVAVLYDVDAEHKAEKRAAEFRAVGVDAFHVPLSSAGFRDHDDVSDVLLREGWTIKQLRRYISGSYRRARGSS
jgi:hypothetical protein